MNKRAVMSLNDLILVIIINLMLFEIPLMYSVNSIFSYVDETVACIAGVLVIRSMVKGIDTFIFGNFVIFGLYAISTVIANYMAGIVTNISYIVIALFLLLRNFMIMWGVYCSSNRLKRRIVRLMPIFINEVKIILLIALLCWPISLLFSTGMSYDVRFGLNTYQFIYHHPGNFSTFLFFALILLTYFDVGKRRFILSKKAYIIITVFLIITTFRYGYFACIGVYLYYRIVTSKRVKPIIKLIIPLIIIVAVIKFVLPQISYYFIETESPRLLLYRYGFMTFVNHPFGTGFATYGSYMAQVHYSPLYYQYGFNYYYGFTETNPLFLFDSFWPMIIAEGGIIGMICIIVWYIFVYSKANKENDTTTKMIVMSFIAFSFVGQTLIHFSSILFFSLMGLTLSKGFNEELSKGVN